MLRAQSLFRFLLVTAVVAVWFSLLIPWYGWNDPDAFYHAKVSEQLWQSGPLKSFGALDLTLLGTHYADLHFGFHVFVAPFTALFGSLQGLRIATILLAALCVATVEACLRWLSIRYAMVWAALLAIAHPFVFRILLGKASPLAIGLFILGLVLAWKRRPLVVGLVAVGFALSHGGWVFVAGSVILLAFGDLAYERLVEDRPWKEVLFRSRWRECLAAWIGGIIGMCIHPNAESIFPFAWAQVVTIGLGTPFQHVLLGQEWGPSSPFRLFVTLAPWLIMMLCGMVGLLFARRPSLNEEHARFLTSLGWVMSVFIALTFKSRRNVEYLMPIIILWCATLWSFVDLQKYKQLFFETFQRYGKATQRGMSIFVVCIVVGVFAKQLYELYRDMNPPSYRDDAYRISINAISERASAGDRVFHSSWDEFPMLYHANSELKYLSGLDPTFLYIASSTLSDRVRNVTWDLSTSTVDETWELIATHLHSKFVFISKKNHQKLLQRIEADSRYKRIADGEDSAAFEVMY